RPVHGRGPLLLGGGLRARQGRTAGVVDHDVEPSETVDGLGDQIADGLVAIQVAGVDEPVANGRGTDLTRRLVQIGLRPAAQGNRDSFLRQHLGARPAQSFARTADDRYFVFQFEVHGGVIGANARLVKSLDVLRRRVVARV